MNEIKTKKSLSISQQRVQSAQRRVSFSKPWTKLRNPERTGSIIRCRAKDKSKPIMRGSTSFSRPLIISKPSLKSVKSSLIRNKAVGTRPVPVDAASSTTTDARRRPHADPTPAHLKYGMFRKFSKLRRSADVSTATAASKSERTDAKPIRIDARVRERTDVKPVRTDARVRERSEVKRQEDILKEQMPKSGTKSPSIDSSTCPLPPNFRHVRLCQTEPIHLDIRPKRFPSMMWC